MSVKRKALLTNLDFNVTAQMVRELCNEHNLNCISVTISEASQYGQMKKIAHVTFLNDAETDRKNLSNLVGVGEWNISESAIVSDTLRFGNVTDISPANPKQFLLDVNNADLSSHPKFGEVMQRGGMTLIAARGGSIAVAKRIKSKEQEEGEEEEKEECDNKAKKKEKSLKRDDFAKKGPVVIASRRKIQKKIERKKEMKKK